MSQTGSAPRDAARACRAWPTPAAGRVPRVVVVGAGIAGLAAAAGLSERGVGVDVVEAARLPRRPGRRLAGHAVRRLGRRR